MPVEQNGPAQERRAGLLGKRFGQQVTHPPAWPTEEERVVDALPARPPAPVQGAPELVIIEQTSDPTSAAPPSPAWQRAPLQPAQALWRLLPPAHNQADLETAARALAAALCPVEQRPTLWQRWLKGSGPGSKRAEVVALEVAGVAGQAQLFLRGPVALVARVYDHLQASYGPIKREVVDRERAPEQDPLAPQSGEAISFAELHLAHPALLPLQTPAPGALAAGADPLAGVVSLCSQALAESPVALRIISQMLVTKAPASWKHDALALLEKRRAQRPGNPQLKVQSQQGILAVLFLLAMLAIFLMSQGWWLILWGVFLPALAGSAVYVIARVIQQVRLTWQINQHEQAVINKVSQEVVQTCLRLYVLGPVHAERTREAMLDRLIAAYSAFSGVNYWTIGRRGHIEGVVLDQPPANQGAPFSAAQGGFSRPTKQYQQLQNLHAAFHPTTWAERLALWFGRDRRRPILSMREVAALWHLPTMAGLWAAFKTADDPDRFSRYQPPPA